MLGPTAEYLADGIKTFAEKRVENVRNIFTNAQKKLGDRINSPALLLRSINRNGQWQHRSNEGYQKQEPSKQVESPAVPSSDPSHSGMHRC
jgi:hypothetical protein